MDKPKIINKVQATRIKSKEPVLANKNEVKKLYVHIKDPDDHDSLILLKKICSDYVGDKDIILVLGLEKKSAIKLPFKVETSDELVEELTKILGKENIILK